MKINSFNSQNLDVIRAEFLDKVAKAAAEIGIEMTFGRITFDATSFRCSLEAKIEGVQSRREERKEDAAAWNLERNGFRIGQVFFYKGIRHTITGASAKRVQNCIHARDERGRTWNFNPTLVRAGLETK